jgi:putative transposase
MEKNSATDAAPLFAGDAWFDPIETELRERVRSFLEEMVEQEATAALGRGRYQRGAAAATGTERVHGGCLARSAQ